MSKNIEPDLKLISQYLKLESDKKFVIPEYQRSYSWAKEQCDKLWEDIESFISSGGKDPYFFGTIIVDCSNNDELYLIDGQQRTTTFLLLLKALLIKLLEVIGKISDDDEESVPLKAGLVANRNKIMEILYKAEAEDIPSMLKDHAKTQNIIIMENRSINELFPEEIKNIINAINFEEAEKIVKKTRYKRKDNKYSNHFRNFKYFLNKLGEKEAFELNQFSKVFLGQCQVIEIRSWQIEQAITMFNSLNSTGMPLSDADMISAQLYSKVTAGEEEKFNEKWKNITTLASELDNNNIVDIDAVLQQYMYIHRAKGKKSGSIDKGLRRYYEEELLDNPIGLCDELSKITNNWDRVKDYPIIKLLLKYNENIKLFLSSYLYRYEIEEITEEKILDICECLLRLFVLLELGELGYSNTRFKTFLFEENLKLVDKNIEINDIKHDFDEHIKKNWDRESIEIIIKEYEKNLLVFLNEYIYSKNKGKHFDFDNNKVNVEHIMPSSGREKLTIRKDAGIESTADFDGAVNKLGNKILLEENINKSLGNDWFRSKKQNSIKDKCGYKDSKYAIASALTLYKEEIWRIEDIEEATEKATNRIMNFIF